MSITLTATTGEEVKISELDILRTFKEYGYNGRKLKGYAGDGVLQTEYEKVYTFLKSDNGVVWQRIVDEIKQNGQKFTRPGDIYSDYRLRNAEIAVPYYGETKEVTVGLNSSSTEEGENE